MPYKRITAGERVPDGTLVAVASARGSFRGKVVGAEWSDTTRVWVHEIKFTEKLRPREGWNNLTKWDQLPKPETRKVNYAFINVVVT